MIKGLEKFLEKPLKIDDLNVENSIKQITDIILNLQAENAALRERLKKAATFALDMCSEDDCAGDGSVGLPPCDMWHAWDTDGNGVNIESGCYLKEYLTELKGE